MNEFFKQVDLANGITHLYKQTANGILHVNTTSCMINILAEIPVFVPGDVELISESEFDALRLPVTKRLAEFIQC